MYKIIDNFLDEDDLNKMKDLLSSNQTIQKITDNDEIPQYIFNKYKYKLTDLDISKVYNKLSLSINQTKNIGTHYDEQLEDETHKVLLYLNNVEDGGTIFFINNKEELIENKENRLVIFDIRLLHKSQVFKKGIKKRALGFRIKVNGSLN
jgi:hypothetical protein